LDKMSDKSRELSLVKARDFKILNLPCSGEKIFINANLILCINCSYDCLRDKSKTGVVIILRIIL